jgi:Zn-finger nucleic acid-binding protein
LCPNRPFALKARAPAADENAVSSDLSAPTCPKCGAELQLAASGKLHAWSCPAHHGVGFTVSTAYERLEADEVHTIWQASEHASPGSCHCPMCSQPMLSVTVAVGGQGSPTETLDVCREDEFIWFDPGELDDFPHGAPPAAPSADEQRKIDQIRATFDHELDAAQADEESQGMLNRFANHVVTAHPGFVHLMDHAVYRHQLDDVEDAHAA